MAEQLSAALGRRIPPSTVQHWAETGHIPASRQDEVLWAARQLGIDLEPRDFFSDASVGDAPAEPEAAA